MTLCCQGGAAGAGGAFSTLNSVFPEQEDLSESFKPFKASDFTGLRRPPPGLSCVRCSQAARNRDSRHQRTETVNRQTRKNMTHGRCEELVGVCNESWNRRVTPHQRRKGRFISLNDNSSLMAPPTGSVTKSWNTSWHHRCSSPHLHSESEPLVKNAESNTYKNYSPTILELCYLLLLDVENISQSDEENEDFSQTQEHREKNSNWNGLFFGFHAIFFWSWCFCALQHPIMLLSLFLNLWLPVWILSFIHAAQLIFGVWACSFDWIAEVDRSSHHTSAWLDLYLGNQLKQLAETMKT